MRMDPVILLAEELRGLEQALRIATSERRADVAHCLMLQIRLLRNCLTDSTPTSALGASELLRLAVEYLPQPLSELASRLVAIADRWSEGERMLDDMIWLRAVADTLSSRSGPRAARLVRASLTGASRPLLIHRSVLPPGKSAAQSSRLGEL
jgi:hypothetical protein